MELDEEGQHVKWVPVLVEYNADIDSALALHVKQLQLSEGCVHSPLSLQQDF